MVEELSKEELEEKSALRFMLDEIFKSKQLEFTIPDIENAKLNGEKFSRNQSDKTLYRLVKDGILKKRGNKHSITGLYPLLKENIGDIEEFIEINLKKNKKNS